MKETTKEEAGRRVELKRPEAKRPEAKRRDEANWRATFLVFLPSASLAFATFVLVILIALAVSVAAPSAHA